MSKFKELSNGSKPREKLALYGPEKLSDVEILAIILQSGSKKESVVSLSQRLLEQFGSIDQVLSANLVDLTKIYGIGQVKATNLVAIKELTKRMNNSHTELISIKEPKDVYNVTRDIHDCKQENLMVICLDNKGKMIAKKNLFVGTISEIVLHPREIFNFAIINQASSIIIAHNHPSGDCTPSQADIDSTKRMHDISKIVGIELIDHIIVSPHQFLSLREKYAIIF